METNSVFKNKILRALFVLTFPILLVQVWFIKQVGEPYPAFVYPGFGHVPQQSHFATIDYGQLVAITMQGDTLPVPYETLFEQIPDRWVPLLMKRRFKTKPGSPPDPEDVPTMEVGPIQVRFPRPDAMQEEQVRDFGHWLGKKLPQLTGRSIEAAAVMWYEVRIDLTHLEVAPDSTLVDIIALPVFL